MAIDKRLYSILIIEDNPGDFALVEDFLFDYIETPVITRARDFKEAQDILSDKKNKFDIVLLDLSLPDKIGEPLINSIINLVFNTPVIVLTGYADFAFGIKSIALGISDYILKDGLTSLSLYKSIIYSSERKKIAAELEESEQKYSELFQLSPLPMLVYDMDTLLFLNVNSAAIKHYGYSRKEFLEMTVSDIGPVEDILCKEDQVATHPKKNNGAILHGIFGHKKKSGELIQVDIQSNIITFKGKKVKVILANDITDQLNYIKAIEVQNERLREISWIQSHIVRAPLSRIMGLVSLITESEENSNDKEKMMEYLLSSANELDEIIKNITDKTSAIDYKLHPF